MGQNQNSPKSRVQAGVPSGGQFATQRRDEASVGLSDTDLAVERVAANVGAGVSTNIRTLLAQGESIGLTFRHDLGSEFGDYKAYAGNGRSIAVDPANPDVVHLIDENEHYHETRIVHPDDPQVTLSLDNPDHLEAWTAQIEEASRDLNKGGNVDRISRRMQGEKLDTPVFPNDLPDGASPADVFTAIPDCSRVVIQAKFDHDDEPIEVRGLVRDIPRWGSDLASEPRRVTTEAGWERFLEPDRIVSIEVTDQSRVSPQWL